MGTYDLLQMYDADETNRYRNIIAEKVMPNRELNLSEISKRYSVRHAFKKLGRFAPFVEIKQSDIQWKDDQFTVIEEILRLIGKRCSSEHLKKVTIIFDEPRRKSPINFCPYIPDSMRSIETLTIIQVGTRKCENFLRSLQFMQMQSLTLKYIDTRGQFLNVLDVSKLSELSIDRCCFRDALCLDAFFRKGIPTLKTLKWNTFVYGLTNMGRYNLANMFPALERLVMDDPFDLMALELPTLKFVDLRVRFSSPQTMWTMFWLSKQKKSLEELSIRFTFDHMYRHREPEGGYMYLWLATMKVLINLRSIKIQCDGLKWNDVIRIVQACPQISEVHLIGKQPLLQAHIRLLALMPQMRCLKFDAPMKTFNVRFYNALLNHRKRQCRDSPTLNVHLASATLGDLKRTIIGYDAKAHNIGVYPLN